MPAAQDISGRDGVGAGSRLQLRLSHDWIRQIYGCHFRANNFLTIFTGHESLWKLGGNATCVPKRCVDVYKTDWYEWDSRHVDLF